MMKSPKEIWLYSRNIPGASGVASPHAIGGLIFIEGDRSYQREKIKEWFSGRDYIWVDSHATNRYIRWRDQEVGNKGYWLFQFEPTMAQRINFFLLRLWDRLIGPRRKLRAILEGLSLC